LTEHRQVLTLVVITLIIGVAAVALVGSGRLTSVSGDAYVEEYTATFYPDGTLVEDYIYILSVERFKFLFRVWEAPISATDPGYPYIEPIQIEASHGAVGYYKDQWGSVFVEEPYDGDLNIVGSVRSQALMNEVGSYDPKTYEVGMYRVRFTFDIHPPLEKDEDVGHLNLKLASTHLPYSHVTIIFEGADYIASSSLHPPMFKVRNEDGRIVVMGSSGKDELIEVEMLVDLAALEDLDGFQSSVNNVRSRTVNSNRATTFQYNAATFLSYGVKALALLMPFLLYAVYQIYGSEEEYTAPEYLSYVPNRDRKPWVVNQIFKGAALDYDDDGFYATLLDLHMRRKIRIETRPGGLLIHIIDDDLDDKYEKRVFGFLQMLSDDGLVDTDSLNYMTKEIKEGSAVVVKYLP